MATPSTLVDLVKIYTANTGTGAITFGPAVAGYRGVEALTDGAQYSYSIQQDAEWELGTGTYLASNRRFVRSPAFSSNGGQPVSFLANAAVSFVATVADLTRIAGLADAARAAAAELAANVTLLSDAVATVPIVTAAASSAAAHDAAAGQHEAAAASSAVVGHQAALDAGSYLQAIRQLTGNSPTTGTLKLQASSRAIMAGYANMTVGMVCSLVEPGREGDFRWTGTDCSAGVARDPLQGAFVPPASDASGASGAWIRVLTQISPEQCGCAAEYNPMVDDRPGVQAAQDLSELFMCPVVPKRDRYALWGTTRTSPLSDVAARDGHYFTFGEGGIDWRPDAGRVTFSLFSRTGGDPSNDVQTVEGQAWIGDGLYCTCGQTAKMVKRLRLRDITIDGQQSGCGYTISADRYNTYNKGFSLLDCQWQELDFDGVEIKNFRGELCIFNSPAGATAYLRRCWFHLGAHNTLNIAGVCRTIISDSRFGDAYASENLLGYGSMMSNVEFYAHGGGLLFNGGPTPSPLYYQGYTTRDNSAPPPWSVLNNIQMNMCGTVQLSSWMKLQGIATDTDFVLAPSNALENLYVDILNLCDKRDGEFALTLYGPQDTTTEFGYGTPAGTYVKPPANSHIRMTLGQTDYARANGLRWRGMASDGLFDPSFLVTLSGFSRDGPINTRGDGAKGMLPLQLEDFHVDHNYGGGLTFPTISVAVGANNIQVHGPMMVINADGNDHGAREITLATSFPAVGAYTPVYRPGQRVRFLFAFNTDGYDSNGKPLKYATFRANAAGTTVDTDMLFYSYASYADFEFSEYGKWALVRTGRLN